MLCYETHEKYGFPLSSLAILTAFPSLILPSEVDSVLSGGQPALLAVPAVSLPSPLNKLAPFWNALCLEILSNPCLNCHNGECSQKVPFSGIVLLTSATTSSSLLQTLSTTIAPPVMQYLCECHILISLYRMFFLPSSTVDNYCAWVFWIFLLLDFHSPPPCPASAPLWKQTSICLWEAMPPFLHPCNWRVFSPGLHICTTQC